MNNPLQLRPIDIGFDPRVHPDMRIEVNLDREYDGCAYSRRDGQDDHVPTWSAALIGAIARREGYRLTWTWPSQNERLNEWSARIATLRTGEPVLEMRNPSEGQSADAPKSRYQYLAQSRVLRSRHLPPRGERWRDEPAAPWWEPVTLAALRPPHLLLDWLEVCGERVEPWQYAASTSHIAAWTPNGREVRYDPDGGLALQPPQDNYWHRCADLGAARAFWYRP